jgi:23S rRNA (cytidine1920-2'-O)/16S rRNA (cytidine1409-2'-O)-methyltransferase
MEETAKFVSRAGTKLSGALDAFGVDVAGAVCADFGCNVGGFTDCLLSRGAAKVYAIDTGYGELAWKLRRDSRVVVMERTNALYCVPPELVDLVVIDVAWTPQELSLPAAVKWLKKPFPIGIISLLKPHYELTRIEKRKPHEVLSPEQTSQVCVQVCQALERQGLCPAAIAKSVISGKGGNTEYLLFFRSGYNQP